MIQLCPMIEVFSDGVIERTEYFTVSLRVPEGADLASCQVAIVDTDGGKIQCCQRKISSKNNHKIILLHCRSLRLL